ncbi:MAG: DUF2147 domain-containing protein [Burkholderiales bacterium]|nr:DUF2147 domain-containing protein [Burkholderiales bacterium]
MRLWQYLASAVLSLTAGVATADAVHGEWVTQGHSGRVLIRGCDNAAEKLCGVIVWLWEPLDKQGRPVMDVRNPSLARRSSPLIGLQMLSDFTAGEKPNSWSGGSIYNPEDGRSYAATLTLQTPDQLVVEGCVLFVCSRQVWRKLPPTCNPPSSTPTRKATP